MIRWLAVLLAAGCTAPQLPPPNDRVALELKALETVCKESLVTGQLSGDAKLLCEKLVQTVEAPAVTADPAAPAHS